MTNMAASVLVKLKNKAKAAGINYHQFFLKNIKDNAIEFQFVIAKP